MRNFKKAIGKAKFVLTKDKTIKSLNLIKKALLLPLFFGFFANFAFADQSELEKLEAKIFTNANDQKITSGICIPTCRAVSDDYIALISDFDPQTGITSCSVYQKDLDYENPLGVNANTINTNCTTKTQSKYEELYKANLNTKEEIIANFIPNDENALKGKVTLSNFIGGVFTLDPKFINIGNTKNSGLLVLQDSVKTIDESAGFLDTANLGMFVGGFANIEKLYRKLLNWLLVFIGAYFLFTIFVDMINSKLEKKDYHFKVLNGILIPVVAFGIFFMPVQQTDDMHSTIFQKITRYFVQEGIKVADLATLHFENAYLKSLFGDLNIIRKENLDMSKISLEIGKIQQEYLKNSYEQCKTAFDNIKTFQLDDKKKQDYLDKDYITDQKDKNKNRIYSFDACQKIENKYLILEKSIQLNENEITVTNNNKGSLATNLSEYNKLLNQTIVDKGFVSAMTMPSNQIFMNLFLNNQISISKMTKTQSIDLEKEKQKTSESDTGGLFGMQLSDLNTGRLAYLVLPGATGIFNVFKEYGENFQLKSAAINVKKIAYGQKMPNKIKKLVFSISKIFKKIPFLEGVADLAFDVMKLELAFTLLATLYDMILETLPILTAGVAAVIALISYIIHLFKFYYLSPIMLMYAVTSKRKDKINDFLVTGITVFIKPLLIVVFLFLAVIFYDLLQDLFRLQNEEQFLIMAGVSGSDFGGMSNDVSMSVMRVLMNILGCIASMYIMFQMIYYGPDRLLKFLGINNGDDGLISNLSNSVSRHMTGGL